MNENMNENENIKYADKWFDGYCGIYLFDDENNRIGYIDKDDTNYRAVRDTLIKDIDIYNVDKYPIGDHATAGNTIDLECEKYAEYIAKNDFLMRNVTENKWALQSFICSVINGYIDRCRDERMTCDKCGERMIESKVSDKEYGVRQYECQFCGHKYWDGDK